MAAVGIALFWSTPSHASNPLLMITIFAAFVGLFTLFARGELDFIAVAPLLLLGRLSYTLYLVHLEVGLSLIGWMEDRGASPLVAGSAAAALALALAAFITATVEVRAQRAILKWYANFAGSGVATGLMRRALR
jgi:peptidoglycan/LPS O-acetylase OafA/YrhL